MKMIHLLLRRGDKSYYNKIKEIYQSDGTWEHKKESILLELSKEYMSHEYAALLAEQGELLRLLNVVQKNPMYIEHYGKLLAQEYPEETFLIYENYIISEAAAATERRKYKGVCKLIKGYSDAGAKAEARNMIQRLIEKYPRRVAMVDELQLLDRKLMK